MFVFHTTLMAVVPTGAGMVIAVPFWLVKLSPLMVICGFCTATVTLRLALLPLFATSEQTMVWVSLKPLNRLERVTKCPLVPPLALAVNPPYVQLALMLVFHTTLMAVVPTGACMPTGVPF